MGWRHLQQWKWRCSWPCCEWCTWPSSDLRPWFPPFTLTSWHECWVIEACWAKERRRNSIDLSCVYESRTWLLKMLRKTRTYGIWEQWTDLFPHQSWTGVWVIDVESSGHWGWLHSSGQGDVEQKTLTHSWWIHDSQGFFFALWPFWSLWFWFQSWFWFHDQVVHWPLPFDLVLPLPIDLHFWDRISTWSPPSCHHSWTDRCFLCPQELRYWSSRWEETALLTK